MAALARRGASSQEVLRVAYDLGGGSLSDVDAWVRKRFAYRAELEEVVRTPEFMLNELEHKGYFDGDCDDASTVYAAVLLALDYRCRFVAIRYDASPEFKHVFVEAFDGGEWVALDPTVPAGTPYTTIERMVMDL